jgi:adenylate cyclase
MGENNVLTGGCACGGVRYEVTAPFVSSNYCHCTRCQRARSS